MDILVTSWNMFLYCFIESLVGSLIDVRELTSRFLYLEFLFSGG